MEYKCQGLVESETEEGLLEEHGITVSKKVADYSVQRYGKIYCYDCQRSNPIVQEEIQKIQMTEKKPKDITHKYQTDNWAEEMVNFETLLDKAHSDKLKSVKTEMLHINWEKKECLFKAEVITEKGMFTGHGDSTTENIPNKIIQPHFIRLAETRALVRALRFATNIAKTASEEIGEWEL